MPVKKSKWKIMSEADARDNASLSGEQQEAERGDIDYLKGLDPEEDHTDEELIQFLQREDLSYVDTPEKSQDTVDDYRAQRVRDRQRPEPEQPRIEPQIENPVNQESMMADEGPLEIDSTVPHNAPGPNVYAKTEKNKKGRKRHLNGTGPVADKANEVYHAIIRDKDGKGEPTKEEQASAAAISWSQAKKTMKKKAYFRGEEATIIDAYRGMWGEDLVRVSVNGQTIDVPRELLEITSTEAIDPIRELKEFVSNVPEEVTTKSEIKANIHNLKIAKDIAYRLITEGHDFSVSEEASIDSVHTACERRIETLQSRLASAMTEADVEYLGDLPKYEVGKNISVSSFSRENDGWMDEIIEKQSAEAEAIDIDKLTNEDPLILVASLTEEVIANATAVRSIALERVSSVAGPLEEDIKNKVISMYLEKTENARRSALARVKQDLGENVDTQYKIARSVPDEGLFL